MRSPVLIDFVPFTYYSSFRMLVKSCVEYYILLTTIKKIHWSVVGVGFLVSIAPSPAGVPPVPACWLRFCKKKMDSILPM